MKCFATEIGLALLLVVGIGGCGGGESQDGAEKAPTKSAKELVIGTWEAKLEVDDQKLRASLGGVDEASVAEFKDGLNRTKLSIDFKADGTYVRSDFHLKTTNGKWEIVSENGATLTMKTTDYGKELTLRFTNDNEFEFTSADSRFNKTHAFKVPFVYKRKK